MFFCNFMISQALMVFHIHTLIGCWQKQTLTQDLQLSSCDPQYPAAGLIRLVVKGNFSLISLCKEKKSHQDSSRAAAAEGMVLSPNALCGSKEQESNIGDRKECQCRFSSFAASNIFFESVIWNIRDVWNWFVLLGCNTLCSYITRSLQLKTRVCVSHLNSSKFSLWMNLLLMSRSSTSFSQQHQLLPCCLCLWLSVQIICEFQQMEWRSVFTVRYNSNHGN